MENRALLLLLTRNMGHQQNIPIYWSFFAVPVKQKQHIG